MNEQQSIRVLEGFRTPRPTTNPYIVQLARALERQSGVDPQMFSWRRAILGRYDVFHVHWPEILMTGHKRSGRIARRALTTLLLLRLWAARIPVVRTVHNIERPSDIGWIDSRLLDGLDRLTRLRIRLNDVTPLPEAAPFATIPHGHYRDWFASYQPADPVPGRLAYVGLIRRYKGVEQLLDAFRGLEDPRLSLHVAGKPSSAELARVVDDAVTSDDRISANLAFLNDAEFVSAMTTAELVVLPYRHMHNSGAVLAALSLDRPVLVPDTEVNRLLADEVGPGWVHTFSGDLGLEDLAKAIAAVPASRPQ